MEEELDEDTLHALALSMQEVSLRRLTAVHGAAFIGSCI